MEMDSLAQKVVNLISAEGLQAERPPADRPAPENDGDVGASRTREVAPMPLKVEPLEEPYLNMTPMVDVILNLLIFFMLGSRFAEDERQLDIQLPSVSHAQSLTRAPERNRRQRLCRRTISSLIRKPSIPDVLEDMLSAAQARYADQAVLIRGDGKGSYQSIMDVLSICQKAKIHNYSLATQPKVK